MDSSAFQLMRMLPRFQLMPIRRSRHFWEDGIRHKQFRLLFLLTPLGKQT